MCGIVGTTNKSGVDIQKALRKIEHRGPDATGLLEHGLVMLGHQRLSIIDTSSNGDQPLVSDDGKQAIVYNGEIYNYVELKDSLQKEGVVFSTGTDTEVILLGYKQHGESFFSRMRGMWAFAISDTEKGELILSRDHLGIKPLFVGFENNDISFGSEMKVMTSMITSLSFNTSIYPFYFSVGYFPAPHTQYKEIATLQPGQVITYNLVSKNITYSWLEPIFTQDAQSEKITDFDEAVESLCTVLEDSVTAHFVSDVPVSLLFSGGNDSSLIAAIAKKLGFNPTAYHLAIDGSKDAGYAKQIAQALDLQVVELGMTKEHVQKAYSMMFAQLDVPLSNPSYITTSIIFNQVKGDSKVVLSGEGGDELFGGYPRHQHLFDKKLSADPSLLIRMVQGLYGQNKLSLRYVNPVLRRILSSLYAAEDSVVDAYMFHIRNIDYPIAYKQVRENLHTICQQNILPAGLAPDRFSYLPNDLLLKNDLASMVSSIEARVPLVDRKVWDFVINKLDPKLCSSPEYSNKTLLRAVLKRYLPTELVDRPKGGFSFSFQKYDIPEYKADLVKAFKFHYNNAEQFGLSAYKSLLKENKIELIQKKYPRFAFSLVVNYRLNNPDYATENLF